ncbi:MAG: hypothetical protein ACP5N1_00070 [Candidatus Woesearchaeota archaeon]
MSETKKSQDLRMIAMTAVFTAIVSWITWAVIFVPFSVGMIIYGFVYYTRNSGPKMHYYMLYVAIIILLLKIPAYFFLKMLF